MLLDDGLVDGLRLGQVGGRLQHAVLQGQHLLQRVVEEGRGEGDGLAVAAVRQAHLELARLLLAVLHNFLRLLLLGLLAGGVDVSMPLSRGLHGTDFAYRSTNVMLSAISATRLAMREAMMA